MSEGVIREHETSCFDRMCRIQFLNTKVVLGVWQSSRFLEIL